MQESNSVNNEIISKEQSKEIILPDIIDETKIKEVINTFCKDLLKINSLNECGWTPLYRTIISGDLIASQILIAKGADPNIKCSMGETPLYQAVDMCRLEHVKLLIKMGADPNISQDDGLTPLHAAVIRQNILIVKYLLKNGANPNIKTKIFNQSPVHLSIKNNVDPMIILLLVQFNGSLLDKDKFGKRPIDYICSKEMEEAIEKLKLGKNNSNSNKKLVLYPLFQTPKKYNNWVISKVYSNTIRSNSSNCNLNFKTNTVLRDAGYLKNNIIGNCYIKYRKLNSSNNLGDARIKNMIKNQLNNNKEFKIINNEKENNIKLKIENEGSEHNLKKRKLSFSIKKGLNKGNNNSLKEKVNIKNVLIIKNKNEDNQKINGDNNNLTNIIFTSKIIKIGKNKNENIQKKVSIKNINNCNKIPKKKRYLNSNYEKKKNISKSIKCNNKTNNNNYKFIKIYGNSKARKGSFSINPEKQRQIQNQSLDLDDFKENLSEKKNIPNNYLYIKPILSLNELNVKKLNLSNKHINNHSCNSNNKNNTIKKNATSNSNNKVNKDVKRLFTFMDKDNIINNNNNNQGENNNLLYGNKNNPIRSRNQNNSNYFDKSFSISKIYTNRNNSSFCNETLQNFLWKFKTIDDDNNVINKKITDNTSTTTCSYNIDITNQNVIYPIYEWLKEINLTCYYKLFIEKKIYNLDKIIYNLKKELCNITKSDILNIGITKPGHIYRIITKLEIDSEKINNQISNFLLGKKNISGNGDINILKNSIVYCCGCCSINNQSKYYCNNNDIKKYELEHWLGRIKMKIYKDNFINNGFDYFEYFILQMFSSIPIDENILKDELKIDNLKDRDFLLLQINKDIKYIIKKVRKINNSSIHEISPNTKKYRYENKNNNKEEKIDETSNCIVF